MSNKTEEKKMKPAAKRDLVPKLRFPEFRDAGGWKERTFSDVLTEHGQKSTGIEEVFSVSVHKGLVNQIEHLGRSFSASSTDHYRRVLPGDIVYTKSPTGDFPLGIIKQSKLDIPVIVSPLYGVFSPETSALGALLDAYFESPENAYIYLESLVQKGAKNTININNRKFLSGTLILPVNKEEQRKIADCLSSIDELVTLEAQKLDTLKAHKKGLMQQLFPAEGETLPKLHFPEFRDAGEWEEKKAGTLFANRIEEGEDGLPIYSVTMNDGMVKRSSLYRKVDDIAESSGNKKAYKDDIAYNMMRMWQGAFGVSVEDCMVSPAYVVLAPEDKVCSDFFGYLFKLPKYLLLLTSHSQGLTLDRLRLYYKDFAQISPLIPTFLEQQKIADCLSSIDELITAQSQKLDVLKTHKKGLMQQLFHSLAKE